MSNEKMKILEMIESKTITAEEGLKLLNAIEHVEKASVINKDHAESINDIIADALEEVEEEKLAAMEEIEEISEEIEEEVDSIVEDLEDAFEDVKDEFKDDIKDENRRVNIEDEIRAQVEDFKKKAEKLKHKVKVDLDINGKRIQEEFDTEDLKREMKNFKNMFKGEFKSFAKEAKRFGREMSKLGKETADLTADIVKESLDGLQDIKPEQFGREFNTDDFVMDEDRDVRNYNIAQEFAIEVEGKKDVSIEVIATDVTLITEERDDILVSYIKYDPKDENLYHLIVEEDSKKVKITEKKMKETSGFSFNFSTSGRELLVRLPRKYKESLSVKTISGDLDMNYLDSDFFRFTSVSGDIKADIIYSVNTLIKTTSGDCSIDLFRGSMMFNSVSGDIKMKYEAFDGDFSMKSVSGDARLYLPNNSEFEVVGKSMSGDMKYDFPLTIIGTKKRGRLRGKVGSDDLKIAFTSTSGDLNIKKY